MESFDKILSILESKNFSKDWEEYQKYKEMKNKLPDIEEMYQIKELKRLICERHEYIVLEKATKLKIIEFELKYGNVVQSPINDTGSIRWGGYTNPRIGFKEIINTLNVLNNKIQVIIKDISGSCNDNDLLEVFKLYGISTEWLQPK